MSGYISDWGDNASSNSSCDGDNDDSGSVTTFSNFSKTFTFSKNQHYSKITLRRQMLHSAKSDFK